MFLFSKSKATTTTSSSRSIHNLKKFQILSFSKLATISTLASTSTSAFTFQGPTLQQQHRPRSFLTRQQCQYQQQYQFQPFHRSLLSTTTTPATMDDHQEQQMFTKLSNRRITALFSARSSNTESNKATDDYSTKNRSRELKRLAKTMEVDVGKVKELLKRQNSKLEPGSKKANYVTWLLEKDSDSTKRKRSDSNNSAATNVSVDTSKPKKTRPKKTKDVSNSNDDSSHNDNLHSKIKFKDLKLHPNTMKAITNILKHEYMTDIQSKTFEIASSGTDVLGRARTGTGKTLAFLTPALERVLESNDYKAGKNIGVLVISPTRELATQIGEQAEKLLSYHKGLSCQVMFGGTKMTRDVNLLNKRLPTILVATPGRLMDHLENTKLNGGQRFGKDIMRDTPLLVLDEADRLLDMGFQREIKKIMGYLPRQERRQTLLFSATVPDDLKRIMAENMREDYVEVDCIGGDGNTEFNEEHTNTLVEQTHIVLPSLDRYVTSVVEIVQHAMEDPEHKLVVFFPTARLVGFFAEFFNLGLGIDVIEIHSRKTQGYRNKASETFRKANTGILFSSDVSARGVDYPNVSGVIQFGIPESRDQYIHRLGRTGRAGKAGKGILVLSPFEAKFVKELKNIDIPVNEEISQMLQKPVDAEIMNDLDGVFNRIRSGDARLTLSAQQAYQAFIGYYRGHMKRTTLRNNEQLVDVANEYSRLMGLKEIPGITKRAAGKMGLKGLPNVRIVDEVRRGGGGRGGGGRGGGRGGGGRGRGRGRR
jgi:ATP-dependent RNA helicase MSS116